MTLKLCEFKEHFVIGTFLMKSTQLNKIGSRCNFFISLGNRKIKKDLLKNLPPPLFKKGWGRLLSRLLAANFRSIRMQQNSNLHTTLWSEFTVFIYRVGDSSLLDTIEGGGGEIVK